MPLTPQQKQTLTLLLVITYHFLICLTYITISTSNSDNGQWIQPTDNSTWYTDWFHKSTNSKQDQQQTQFILYQFFQRYDGQVVLLDDNGGSNGTQHSTGPRLHPAYKHALDLLFTESLKRTQNIIKSDPIIANQTINANSNSNNQSKTLKNQYKVFNSQQNTLNKEQNTQSNRPVNLSLTASQFAKLYQLVVRVAVQNKFEEIAQYERGKQKKKTHQISRQRSIEFNNTSQTNLKTGQSKSTSQKLLQPTQQTNPTNKLKRPPMITLTTHHKSPIPAVLSSVSHLLQLDRPLSTRMVWQCCKECRKGSPIVVYQWLRRFGAVKEGDWMDGEIQEQYWGINTNGIGFEGTNLFPETITSSPTSYQSLNKNDPHYISPSPSICLPYPSTSPTPTRHYIESYQNITSSSSIAKRCQQLLKYKQLWPNAAIVVGVDSRNWINYRGRGGDLFATLRIQMEVMVGKAKYEMKSQKESIKQRTKDQFCKQINPLQKVMPITIQKYEFSPLKLQCERTVSSYSVLIKQSVELMYPYWLLQHHWGKQWGERGTIILPKSAGDWNQCAICSDATVPIVEGKMWGGQ